MVDLNYYRKSIQSLLKELYSYDQSIERSILSLYLTKIIICWLMWVGNKSSLCMERLSTLILNKIWIQRNNTEINLVERLIAQGIPNQNIVLGLYSFMRRAFGYAVS